MYRIRIKLSPQPIGKGANDDICEVEIFPPTEVLGSSPANSKVVSPPHLDDTAQLDFSPHPRACVPCPQHCQRRHRMSRRLRLKGLGVSPHECCNLVRPSPPRTHTSLLLDPHLTLSTLQCASNFLIHRMLCCCAVVMLCCW